MRFATLAAISQPPLPPTNVLKPPQGPGGYPGPPQQTQQLYGMPPYPPAEPENPPAPPPATLVLSDDPPNPMQVKMGPIGQIIKGGPTGSASKKKKATVAGVMGAEAGLSTPKKKKGMVGVGTGNGRKKKTEEDPQPQPPTAIPYPVGGPYVLPPP